MAPVLKCQFNSTFEIEDARLSPFLYTARLTPILKQSTIISQDDKIVPNILVLAIVSTGPGEAVQSCLRSLLSHCVATHSTMVKRTRALPLGW